MLPHRSAAAGSVAAILLLTAVLLPGSAPGAEARHAQVPTPLARDAVPGPGAPPGTPAPAWLNRTAGLAPSPSARWGAMTAYDAADGYLLLFGGLGSSHGALRDTWSWQDGSWTNRTATVGSPPTARYLGSMAYDSTTGEIVLFGGIHSGGVLRDTWTFGGGRWSAATPATSPPALSGAALADDPGDHQLLLFGGNNASGNAQRSTWSYANGTWTNRTASLAASPPALSGSSATYDPALGATLLFGGAGDRRAFNETWSFSGQSWTNRTSTSGRAPDPREAAGLAYDAVDGYDLLFGGYDGNQLFNDSWAYSSVGWSKLFPGPAPSPRNAFTMGYTPGNTTGNASVVLFGGRAATSPAAVGLSDTWTYKVPIRATISLNPATIDQGGATTFTLVATGGFPPYTVNWTELPAGCVGPTVVGGFRCQLPTGDLGAIAVDASVSDASGATEAAPPQTLQVNLPPSVTATAVPTAGAAPLAVAFSANVTDGTGPFRYLWNFGDGNRSTLADATNSYGRPGTFNASVQVTDSVGGVNTSRLLVISVSSSFALVANASTYVGLAPLKVDFTALATGGSGGNLYAWSFGLSGATANVADPSYTYAAPGTYTVNVTATDSDGRSARASLTETVIAPLDSDFAASFPTAPVCANGSVLTLVQLTAEPTGGVGPYRENWTVNGTPLSGPTPSLTLPGGAYLPVNLTTTDSRGDVARSAQGLRVPTTACGGPTGGPTVSSGTLEIAELLGALLIVVIGVELVLLYRGRDVG